MPTSDHRAIDAEVISGQQALYSRLSEQRRFSVSSNLKETVARKRRSLNSPDPASWQSELVPVLDFITITSESRFSRHTTEQQLGAPAIALQHDQLLPSAAFSS